MFDGVKEDFDRCCQVDYGVSGKECSFSLRVWCNGYGLQTLAAYRFCRWCLTSYSLYDRWYKFPLYPVAALMHKIVGRMYDIKILPGAEISSGCYIGHFGGIRLGNCSIGRQCNINHQVEIGWQDLERGNRVKIEDRVWIGAHSKIYGNLVVRTGAALSAGTTVTHDVPAGVLVAGPKARLLKNNYDNLHLLGLSVNV